MKKVVPARPKYFSIVFNKLKENFSISSSEYREHFSDLVGYMEKIVIRFQGQSVALFLVETKNDIQFRLFDTDQPEKYFISELWVPESKLRSGRPFLLNWKCLYNNPRTESWCDVQLPLHRTSARTKAIVFKLLEIIDETEKALVSAQ